MTYGARLFLIILALQFLTANPVPLEYPIIPKIDCNDLNSNGNPDFIAINISPSPRSIYHFEFTGSEIELLWNYSIPENIQGYFVDMIFGDFDNDGKLELIVAAYIDGGREIFYVFPVYAHRFSESPKIMGISNSSLFITEPRKLYPMNIDSDGHQPFILTQGSPSRNIIICKYIDGTIKSVGSYANKFLNHSMGPLELSLGDFDGDNIEDIFILSNGTNPEGHYIYSDGLEENVDLDNFSHLRFLYSRGIDLNFDGTDDLLMVDQDGGLMSNIWGIESISLSESKIQNILVNLDNGLIHINSISQTGQFVHYTVDPLTREILTTEYNLSKFTETEFLQAHSLFTKDYMFLIHDGDSPEFWLMPLDIEMTTETPPSTLYQKIYSRSLDYLMTREELFIHPIEVGAKHDFLNFTGEYLPLGMEMNLSNMSLEWIPNKSQLGFHEFSYTLELREKGELEAETDNGKRVVNQRESLINKNHSYLAYVNYPVKFSNNKNHTTIVNGDPFEWIIPIDDYNIDASLTVKKISGEKELIADLLQPENILTYPDKSSQNTKDMVTLYAAEKPDSPDSILTKLDAQFQEISYSEIVPYKLRLTWTPKIKPDDYHFIFTVSDKYTNDTLNITITVHPEIDISMNVTEFIVAINESINIPLKIKQSPPSNNYNYKLINSPENMWITKGGVINWIPLATQVDNYLFSVEVSDGIAKSKLEYKIYVNAVPVISSRPSEQFFISQGDSLSFPLESFDMNTDVELSWKLLAGPIDMILTSNGILKWTGYGLDHHPYIIQLSDGIDSIQWKGSIYVNLPPSFTSDPVTFISENDIYKYPLYALDENIMNPWDASANEKIEFKLAHGPSGMEINDDILWWKTEKKTPGKYSVSIIASDGIENTLQSFQLLVNSFPTITSIDSFSVKLGDTLGFNIMANDLNVDDSLSYFIDDLRPGMSLNQGNGHLIWIPSKSDIGKNLFNLQVKDGHDDAGTKQKIQIFVYDPPIFTGSLLTEAFVGLEYATFLTAEDMYGQKLDSPNSIIIVNTTIKDYNLSGEYGRYFQWIPKIIDIGEHEIQVSLTDKYGFTKLHTHNISVFNNPCFQCGDKTGGSPSDTTNN